MDIWQIRTIDLVMITPIMAWTIAHSMTYFLTIFEIPYPKKARRLCFFPVLAVLLVAKAFLQLSYF